MLREAQATQSPEGTQLRDPRASISRGVLISPGQRPGFSVY